MFGQALLWGTVSGIRGVPLGVVQGLFWGTAGALDQGTALWPLKGEESPEYEGS